MRDHTPIRARMTSWRIAIATVGVAAMAVTLGQSVSTLANPNEAVSTEGSQIATGNFFPTPLTSEVRCQTTGGGNLVARRAEVSWNAVPGATGYILELVQWDSNNPNATVRQTYTRSASETSLSGIQDTGRNVLYARVRTVNGPAVSSGYATPPQRISWKDIFGRTECENTGHPGVPNQPWENTSEWNPALPAPAAAGLQVVMAVQRSAPVADVEQPDDSSPEIVAAPGEKTLGETSDSTTEQTTVVTSPSLTTPAPAQQSATSRSSSPPAPSRSATARSSTTAASAPTPTSTRASSSSPQTVATTGPTTSVPSAPVRLPGGGEAEIVDGTTLVVSGKGEPRCSVKVREGSSLEVRGGILTVFDPVETRVVDPESCELSEV